MFKIIIEMLSLRQELFLFLIRITAKIHNLSFHTTGILNIATSFNMITTLQFPNLLHDHENNFAVSCHCDRA